MPRKGRRKYSVEFDDYTLTSLDGELTLINELGLKVNLPSSEIGDRIAEIINEDPYFYYKIIPLTKYYDIITYNLIDSVVKVGGFYGDLLDACYQKDKRNNKDMYLPYAFNKIFTTNVKIYDPISDEALMELINRYDWNFIRIYEELRSIFRISKEKAYNKVIEEISNIKELDVFRIYVIYVTNKEEAQRILEETVVTPNTNYNYKYIIPRWGLLGINNDIINMLNDLGLRVHRDSLKFSEVKKVLEKIRREKITIVE